MPRRVALGALVPLVLLTAALLPAAARRGAPAACTRDAGLVLPEGFCAVVVADNLGPVRHLTLSPSGDLFVAMRGGNGGVVALRDTDGDGRADVVRRLHSEGGTGILWHQGWLWFSPEDQVLRWRLPDGQLEPQGGPEVVVDALPTAGHSAKTVARLGGDTLIVNIGSETNSCQESDRRYRSPGRDPCRELETRAGLWRFSAERTGQRQTDGARYATGLRNAEAIGVHPGTGKLYAVPHGRDQLAQNWGFTDAQSAELPSEEMVLADPGDDFGWPYCYHDWQQGRRVLAPEYGGDGRAVGRCAGVEPPVVAFPGHWAPIAVAFYSGSQFPARYRGGAFVAFRGSWNRAPLPQAGYRVAFVPFANGRPTGQFETFATGQGGSTSLRASGVAVGPDGSLYISGENSGTVWKVMAR